MNHFIDEININLPRILSLFDVDQSNESYGSGDRFHWAWSLIDFGNGTFQGASHGFARLWKAKLWPYKTSSSVFFRRINSLFLATKYLQRKDGSLEESFPNESSFCVTSLVCFDLICTLELLKEDVEKTQYFEWMNIVEKMIRFLEINDESHALISNHLATASAALFKWYKLTGEINSKKRGKVFLERIIRNQSKEGWFVEYEGFDAGYQSLCTHYLAEIHRLFPDLGLFEPLKRSIRFLNHFAHPDGSFGGIYGSRCTRFYYPSGISFLSKEIEEAKELNKFLINSIYQKKIVTLSSIDEPNLIPMFNSYVCSACIEHENKNIHYSDINLPMNSKNISFKYFKDAGIIIDKGINHYTIISTHKGGVIYHFNKKNKLYINSGILLKNKKEKIGSNQSYNKNNYVTIKNNIIYIESTITTMPKKIPTPFQFIIIRILSLSFFKVKFIKEFFKNKLVYLLIIRKKYWPVKNMRKIKLGEELSFCDQINPQNGYKLIKKDNIFVSIHMASQGYWQIQDEEN